MVAKNRLLFLFCLTIFLNNFSFSLFEDSENYLKSLFIKNNKKKIKKAFFSPDDDLKTILVSMINCEQQSVKLAIYIFTHKEIAQAIIDAYERGVEIECVADHCFLTDRYSKIHWFFDHNIPIWMFDSSSSYHPLMHNKFLIFKKNILGKSLIWTGSYNLTNKASKSNQENVIIIENKEILKRFRGQFNKLKERSILKQKHRNKENEFKSLDLFYYYEYFKNWFNGTFNTIKSY